MAELLLLAIIASISELSRTTEIRGDMPNTLDMTNIRQKYPNRWLLLTIHSFKDGNPLSGRVLAHSKHRQKVYDARTRAIALYPDLDLRIIFTGDQKKIGEISPEGDLKLAMAEGTDHAEIASLLFAEDIEKANLEAELKKQQITDLEKVYKEQRIINTPANWYDTYQHATGRQQASDQPNTSDEKAHHNQKQSTDE